MLNSETSNESFDPNALLQAITALKKGDFSTRLPEHSRGIGLEIARAFNGIAKLNEGLASDLERACDAGSEKGKAARSKERPATKGAWAKSFKLVKHLADMSARASKKAAVVRSTSS